MNEWMSNTFNSFIVALSHIWASPWLRPDTFNLFLHQVSVLEQVLLIILQEGPFSTDGARWRFSDLRVRQNHLDSVLKTGMIRLHSQSFWFGESEVGSENLHFQVPRRCWNYTWRTGLWNFISGPTVEHILLTCCLFSISHLKPYSHPQPQLISPRTACEHNILYSSISIFLGLYPNEIIIKIHVWRGHWKTAVCMAGVLDLSTIDMWGQRILCRMGCPVNGSMFIWFRGLYPPPSRNASRSQVWQIKNVFRHCQMSPGGRLGRAVLPLIYNHWYRQVNITV